MIENAFSVEGNFGKTILTEGINDASGILIGQVGKIKKKKPNSIFTGCLSHFIEAPKRYLDKI